VQISSAERLEGLRIRNVSLYRIGYLLRDFLDLLKRIVHSQDIAAHLFKSERHAPSEASKSKHRKLSVHHLFSFCPCMILYTSMIFFAGSSRNCTLLSAPPANTSAIVTGPILPAYIMTISTM